MRGMLVSLLLWSSVFQWMLCCVLAQQILGDCDETGDYYIETGSFAVFTFRSCLQSETQWMRVVWESVIEYSVNGYATDQSIYINDSSGVWQSDSDSLNAEYQVSSDELISSNVTLTLYTQLISTNISSSTMKWGFRIANWKFYNTDDTLVSNFTLYSDNDHHSTQQTDCATQTSSGYNQYCFNEFVISSPKVVPVSGDDGSIEMVNVTTDYNMKESNPNEAVFALSVNGYRYDHSELIFDSFVDVSEESDDGGSNHNDDDDDDGGGDSGGLSTGDILGITAGSSFGFCIFGILIYVGIQRFKDAQSHKQKKVPLIIKPAKTRRSIVEVEMH